MSKLEVYFLGHSGFAIELNDKLLIFDYYIDDNNVLTKLFPKNHKKYFFSSHNHHDHYNEEILKSLNKTFDFKNNKFTTILYFLLRLLVLIILIYSIVIGKYENAFTCLLVLILL